MLCKAGISQSPLEGILTEDGNVLESLFITENGGPTINLTLTQPIRCSLLHWLSLHHVIQPRSLVCGKQALGL